HLKIIESYTEKSLKQYYDLLKETYAYNNFTPLPFQFYKDVITHYHEKGECRFLLAVYKGKPIGTIVGITYKETLYYWTGGFLREQSQLYPNDLLQWELIKWGYQKGVKIYDMLGGDIEGIRNFKLGFGGELVEYKKVFSGKKLYLLASLYAKFGMGLRNVLRRI
ncbi:MAG: GNAT family N-acetyltransferase, partial [Nanoarchaeota archaeon]